MFRIICAHGPSKKKVTGNQAATSAVSHENVIYVSLGSKTNYFLLRKYSIMRHFFARIGKHRSAVLVTWIPAWIYYNDILLGFCLIRSSLSTAQLFGSRIYRPRALPEGRSGMTSAACNCYLSHIQKNISHPLQINFSMLTTCSAPQCKQNSKTRW